MEPTSRETADYRPLKTVAVILGYFTMGLAMSVVGPSIVSMEVVLGVDTQKISWALTGKSLGFLLGTVTSGLLYSRLSKELLFSVLFFSLSISTFCIPLVEHFIYFVSFLVLNGFSIGCLDATGQCYMLHTWSGHRRQPSVFQTMYSSWSLGTICGPFLMTPFLVDIQDPDIFNATNATAPSSHFGSSWNFTLGTTETPDVRIVRYGYMLVGCLPLIPLVLFLVYQRLAGCSFRSYDNVNTSVTKRHDHVKTHQKRTIAIYLATMLSIFFWYMFVNNLTFSYIATYAVKALGWQNSYGGLITSAFFGGHLFMKLVGIYLLTLLQARTLLYIQMTFAVIFYGLFTIAGWSNWILLVATLGAGMSMSSIQSCLFLWSKRYIGMSGKLSSAFMTSCSLGYIAGPLLSGFVFNVFGLEAFTYIVTIGSGCMFTSFIIADAFSRKELKNTSGHQGESVVLQ